MRLRFGSTPQLVRILVLLTVGLEAVAGPVAFSAAAFVPAAIALGSPVLVDRPQ